MTNPLTDKDEAAKKITGYLESLIARTGLDLTFELLVCDSCATCDEDRSSNRIAEIAEISDAAASSDAAAVVSATVSPPADPHSGMQPETIGNASVTVEFTGPDTPLLLARNGELLHSIEHLAAKILGLEPDEHDRISFDAAGYKATRHAELERSADLAVESVRSTGRPYAFAPMTSRERRMLHLILTRSGLPTASSSDGPRRFVVLYPEGGAQPERSASHAAFPSNHGTSAQRTEAIRNRFRRR